MTHAIQAQTFGAIRIEGQGNQLVINQTVHIAANEIKSRSFWPASPYRGLKAFDEVDKGLFFGRDATIAELIKAVAQHPLLMVSGASGSGKSSVVRAGLLPQLTKSVQGFRAFKMKPGSDPFKSLQRALIYAGIDESEVEFAATMHSGTLAGVSALRPSAECWLLFIDQFEELFTLCNQPEKRDTFFAGLLALTAVHKDQFKIVLTMRSDFFDRFDLYPELLGQVRRGLLFVTSPTADELRQCIEQPAAQHGVVFEDGLVEQILSGIKGQPGALPLLQYMLDRLWCQDNPVDDRTLNKSSYEALGGVKGALCQRADAVYASRKREPRSDLEQQTMRRVLLRLVEVSGQGDSALMVSRRRPLGLFSKSEQAVVRELIEEKLLITNAEQTEASQDVPRFEEATVELAHESLLFAWPKLAEWLKEVRQVLFVRNRLSNDALEWQRLVQQEPKDSSRADEELWTGTRLAQAQELRARGDFRTLLGELSPDEESFLDASNARVAERLRHERQAAEKIHQLLLDTYIDRGHQLLFEKNKPYSAVLWLHRAYEEGSKYLALPHLLRSAMLFVDATKAILSGHGGGVESAMFSPDGQRILTASADKSARVWGAADGRLLIELVGHRGRVLSARYSPDGRRILTASADKSARVWDAADGFPLSELVGHGSRVLSARYSPDGRRILTGSHDHKARIWDAEDGFLVAELIGHGDSVHSARYSPDGRRILTASWDHSARIWDAADGCLLTELIGHKGIVESAMFSPDGRRILTASADHTARVWDAENGRLLAELTGHTGRVWSARYSPDGQHILTASADHTARIWDAKERHLQIEIKGHEDSVHSARYSPDGRRILTASEDHIARVWDAADGLLLADLTGHGSTVLSARYSSSGLCILTASLDNTARSWNAEHGRMLAECTGHADGILSAKYSPDGRRIVTASKDKTARVWDVEQGRLLAEFSGHGDSVLSARYSPDGRRILTASADQTVRVWDAQHGRPLAELTGHGGAVLSARYSPDGQRILTASGDHTARVWDAEHGSLLAELTGHRDSVWLASYSPDGRRILTASGDKTARVWDAEQGRLLAKLTGHGGAVLSARYSPDGRRILTASGDHTARVWDAKHGSLLVELIGHWGAILSARYSPDGRHILTATEDHTARVWDAEHGRLLAELIGHGGSLWSARYSPDGRHILTASSDRTARVWDAEHGHLLAILTGHKGSVESSSYSRDGQRILTASQDKTARVWDASPETRTPEQLARVIHSRSCVRFEPEDSSFIVPCTPPPTDS